MTLQARASTGSNPIRLLQFLPVFKVGGTERHVTSLSLALDRSRFDLHFGCMRREGEFLADVQARRIPVTEYRIHRLYGAHTLREQVKFARYLRRNRIEIVHSYNFHANCFAVPAARLARTPVIVASIRDTGALLTPHQRRAHRVACRLANVVLVNADAVRLWLIGQGYDPARIVVIRNGIDLARFGRPRTGAGVRQELGVSADAPLIAMLARINRLKGVEYFLEAAASVAAGFPDARFLVVGDAETMKGDAIVQHSDYLRELEGHLCRLGLQGRVVFTGFRLDIPELLSEVTASVLPSLSEGLSNAVLESMAAAVPVVATQVGGLPEAIEDGVTGLLVPPRDSAALAKAIARILEDRELAARLGQAGHRRVAERFSLPNMVSETEQFYSTLLGQTRRGTAHGVALDSERTRARGRLRRRVKSGAASLLYQTGGDRMFAVLAGVHRAPLVLGYHRVVENYEPHARVSIPAMLVSRRTFEAQLDWIGRRYRFISFDELLRLLASGEPCDRPVAAVSFDDGYADVYENAFPLLVRKGIPAAVFVVTDLTGTSHLQMYDKLYLLLARARSTSRFTSDGLIRQLTEHGIRLAARAPVFDDPFTAMRVLLETLPHAELARVVEALEARVQLEAADLEPLRPLSWDQVSEMHRAGLAIGSHTKRHVLLTNEAPGVTVDEIAGSRRDLERGLGAPVRYLAYPDGRFNSAVVSAVADAGYQLAVTACGHRESGYPLLTVPRRLLWEHATVDAALRFSPATLSCYVNGVFDWTRRCALDHRGTEPHGGSACA